MNRHTLLVTLLCLLSLLALTAGWVAPARAQDDDLFKRAGVEYTFGEQITFSVQLAPSANPTAAWITFGTRGKSDTRVEALPVEAGSRLSYDFIINGQRLSAFSTIEYHFTIQQAGGQKIDSPAYSFEYDDNRFEWDSLADNGFAIYWYDGDQAFAQSVADVAIEGLRHAREILSFADPGPIDLYIYASNNDLLAALPVNGIERVVGHADPEFNVLVAALPPGPDQRLLTEQRIPHELMHILLYQKTGSRSSMLPAWLNEGLASMNELYPDPDYQILLENAQEEGRLLPIAQLCDTFPSDSSGISLAYAQSASFSRYLHRTYGTAALESLVSAYTDGLSCQRGVETVYGLGLDALEDEWRLAAFAPAQPQPSETVDLLPWVAIISAAVAVPVFLSLSSLRKPHSRKEPQVGR